MDRRPLPPVRLDPEAIAQVVSNLLDNAIKYSGDGRQIGVALGARGGGVTVAVRDLVVDFRRHRATRRGEEVALSARELELLRYFARHRCQVVTREALLDDVWGYEAIPLARTVDVHIAKLRWKVEETPSDPKHIVTVHRVGYKLVG